MTAALPGEEFTELVDADIPRVDLVGKAANGTRFLIAKAADDGRLTHPLVPADMVRDLIAKAQEAEPVTAPAPTADAAAADVAKDAPPVAADDLIPETPGGTTASSLPGSPDWETLDGDTAMGAVAVLGRVKAALGWLADREAQESVTGGDPDSSGNALDLGEMACTLDYLIGRLAGFAVGEHLEADMAPELEQVGKAAADVAAPLSVLEKFGPVVKAGRVLSSANEQAIRQAVDSLTGVLNSLPQAPAAEDVTKTKETDMADALHSVAEAGQRGAEALQVLKDAAAGAKAENEVLAKALAALPRLDAVTLAETLLAGGRTRQVAKAAGDPQMAVFDADGKLVGTVDPSKLSPIATSPAAADKADAEPAAEEPAADDATPEAPAPAADPADGQVIPGTDTVQAPAPEDDTQTPAVTKTADTAQLEEQVASLAKQLAELAEGKAALEETVRKIAASPDDRRSPVLNGATGTPGPVTRDGSQIDEFADLKKAVADAGTDGERKAAQAALTYAQLVADVNRRFAR